MVSVQQVFVAPRYPGLRIAILAERLEEAIKVGEDLAMSDPYCYVYNPRDCFYELADGTILQCYRLEDEQYKLKGCECDQVFICGYRAISSMMLYNILRESCVPEKYKLQFIKE